MAILKRKVSSPSALLPVDMMDLNNPQDVIDYAAKLHVKTIPFDLDDFINKIGVELRRVALADDISGKLQKNEDGKWTISVNCLHHPKRQRFTLAHELGHYFLHRNRAIEFVDKALYRSSQMDSMEYEANNFAGALLMPRKILIDFIQKKGANAEVIAEYFDVSVLAAKIRVETLQRKLYEY
ncbi:ImmA/IrrE family metallo-endopeptidase [Bacillus amyloliquefaciens]|nr:ImmA/IrrE family metallo-endopeptidase [Bacillus amyloliquefaciens]